MASTSFDAVAPLNPPGDAMAQFGVSAGLSGKAEIAHSVMNRSRSLALELAKMTRKIVVSCRIHAILRYGEAN
jgi:hypothetical protein